MSDSANSTNNRLRVLVIGAGGRDHALCLALHNSERCAELHAVPGNSGISQFATSHPDIALDDIDAIVATAVAIDPDFVVIGPEDLLVAGLASKLHSEGLRCLGPSKNAAELEGSKRFAKELMEKCGVPTPAWRYCTTVVEAHEAVEFFDGRVAVKADGLAAGCGAFVCQTHTEAEAAIHLLMVEQAFGASGKHVVIEQLVAGDEASVMVLVDGTNVVPLPTARDYKRFLDEDTGPNTGGMGAYAPSETLPEAQAKQLAKQVVQPIVDQLRVAGSEYRGVIYAGVMLTESGPQVLEYNCRFGNPETQALVRVLGERDLLDLLDRAERGALSGVDAVSAHGFATAVCIAAENYPDLQLEPELVPVKGLIEASELDGVEIFHGFAHPVGERGDEIAAVGGRVVTVSGWGESRELAAERAYAAVHRIKVPNGSYRNDIGRLDLRI